MIDSQLNYERSKNNPLDRGDYFCDLAKASSRKIEKNHYFRNVFLVISMAFELMNVMELVMMWPLYCEDYWNLVLVISHLDVVDFFILVVMEMIFQMIPCCSSQDMGDP